MATPDLDTANSARWIANRSRAEALISIAEGRMGLDQAIALASTEEGRPLLRLTLRQLLLSLPGWGPERTARALEAFRNRGGEESTGARRRSTISWLLDRRSSGKRFIALTSEAQQGIMQHSWPFAAQRPRNTARGNGSIK